MARTMSRLLILSLVLAPRLSAQNRSILPTAPNVVSTPIYITHVTVIDTTSGKEDRDRTVIISGNRYSGTLGQSGPVRTRSGKFSSHANKPPHAELP